MKAGVLLSYPDDPISDSCLQRGYNKKFEVPINTSRINNQEMRDRLTTYDGSVSVEGTGDGKECHSFLTNYTLKEMGFYDSCSDPGACKDAKDEFNPSDYLLELMQALSTE